MTNIILLVRDRPRLTQQCLRSISENTVEESYNLVVLDDGSDLSLTETVIHSHCLQGLHRASIRFVPAIGIVGFLRNVGAWASERYFGRGDWLCFLDNDVAVFPNWLDRLSDAIGTSAALVIGGNQHPYHRTNEVEDAEVLGGSIFYPLTEVHLTDAVAGYSLMMSWETWDTYGPFASNQRGVGASEDYAFCRKVVEDGGKVGYIHPPVLAHCGITNTDGKPATGADQFERAPGLLYE